MSKTSKIYLEYDPRMDFPYRVTKLVNRVTPTIGKGLKKETVYESYITVDDTEVIITARKT